MNQTTLRKKTIELFHMYWPKGRVVWGMTKMVRGISPQIVLTMSDVTRTYHPIRWNDKGVQVQSYTSQTTLQVDLFTEGNKIDVEGMTTISENTAVDDMLDFINFLCSEFVGDWCVENDIVFKCDSSVRDLTQLINDTSWDYRSMIEIEVCYTQHSYGRTGISKPQLDENGKPVDENGNPYDEFKLTPSGGGTKELADMETGWFDRVIFKERNEQL